MLGILFFIFLCWFIYVLLKPVRASNKKSSSNRLESKSYLKKDLKGIDYTNRNPVQLEKRPEKLSEKEILKEIARFRNEIAISEVKKTKQQRTKTTQTRSKKKTRVCSKCNQCLPLNDDYFGHTPSGNFKGFCRKCMNKRSSEYAKNNPDSVKRRSDKRRANAKDFKRVPSLIERLYKEQNGKCGLCGKDIKGDYLDSKNSEIEHLIPVNKGGLSNDSNLVLAHPKCNKEKATKTLSEYFQWREKVGKPRSSYFSPKIEKALKNF